MIINNIYDKEQLVDEICRQFFILLIIYYNEDNFEENNMYYKVEIKITYGNVIDFETLNQLAVYIIIETTYFLGGTPPLKLGPYCWY